MAFRPAATPASPAFGDATAPSSPAHYTPAQTMVLFLDFHNLFIQSLGEAGERASQQATTLASWARNVPDLHIGHVLLASTGTPYPTCKGQDRWTGILTMLSSTPTSYAEPAGIAANPDTEPLFTRQAGCVSALSCDGLEAYLNRNEIKHLVLCGLTTSRCVMFTALAAAEKEYVVTVVEDACAERSLGTHEAAREVVDSRCWVVGVQEVVDQLFGGSGHRS